MLWQDPTNLIWAALAVPIVLLYLVFRRRVSTGTATLPLWQKAYDLRGKWSRRRRPVWLVVQLALLGLMIMALAHPLLSSRRDQARTVVLILDVSASMNAGEAESSRWTLAQLRAANLIDRLTLYERMAVFTAGSSVQVRCGLCDDRQILHEVRSRIQPTHGASHVEEAVRLAKLLLSGEPNGQILIVSDGCVATDKQSDPMVAWHLVGSDAENQGITRFEVRPKPNDPTTHEALIEVSNFSVTTAECEVSCGLVDRPPQTFRLQIPSGGFVSHVVSLSAADGGVAYAQLTESDALAADNLAQVLLPPTSDSEAPRDWTEHRPTITTNSVVSIPGSNSRRTLVGPDLRLRQNLAEGVTHTGPLPLAGVWKTQPERMTELVFGPPLIAANLLSRSESDLRRREIEAVTDPDLAPLDCGWPLWSWIVGLAVAAMLGEWILFYRGVGV